jgi:putative Ca2+/H+ antiporter (TMEM165/GDT1 family)
MSVVLQDWAQNSVLGKSGFLAAFALIFLSEIGDKTFFIAGLLAMKVGRWCSFAGSTLALGVMTVISVGIGYAFKSVPDALKSSIPIGEILGVGLMVYFGVKTLKVC